MFQVQQKTYLLIANLTDQDDAIDNPIEFMSSYTHQDFFCINLT